MVNMNMFKLKDIIVYSFYYIIDAFEGPSEIFYFKNKTEDCWNKCEKCVNYVSVN